LSVSIATNLPENHRAMIATDLQAGVPSREKMCVAGRLPAKIQFTAALKLEIR
jgi:hypothetical protein